MRIFYIYHWRETYLCDVGESFMACLWSVRSYGEEKGQH